jgi:hypothetical protein
MLSPPSKSSAVSGAEGPAAPFAEPGRRWLGLRAGTNCRIAGTRIGAALCGLHASLLLGEV